MSTENEENENDEIIRRAAAWGTRGPGAPAPGRRSTGGAVGAGCPGRACGRKPGRGEELGVGEAVVVGEWGGEREPHRN